MARAAGPSSCLGAEGAGPVHGEDSGREDTTPDMGPTLTTGSLLRLVLSAGVALLLGYAALCLLVYWRQATLVYFPEPSIRVDPSDVGLTFRDLELTTADGERLHAWAIPPVDPGAPWVLFSHGNGGNMSHRLERALILHRIGVGVLFYDYRGYGRSTGIPSEEGLGRDAEAAWGWLAGEEKVPPGRIVLMGESLGGGVTTSLAARHRPAGMILESTFTSAADLGAELYPWLPVRLLSRHRYPSRDRLADMDFPKLFMHSPQDDVIPYHHGRDLFEAAPEPKEFADLAGGHNASTAAQGPTYVTTVSDFLRRATAAPSGR